jgi:hypothetical protein
MILSHALTAPLTIKKAYLDGVKVGNHIKYPFASTISWLIFHKADRPKLRN